MTRTRTLLLSTALSAGLLWVGPATGAGETTFQGEIADSQCAMGVHSLTRSHKEMIDMGHAGSTPEDCTKYCVHSRGGRFVLLTKRDVFKLDNQEAAENYAGKKVRVTGTLDPKTNIIAVRTIEPVTAK
ncbi:MAG TPA: DUF5818 domain-containing protein [Candidatus Methylomirabilis sp.]|nr:DUF5818 domain-containing protein [Candidatus Methylomirabilis sp.]